MRQLVGASRNQMLGCQDESGAKPIPMIEAVLVCTKVGYEDTESSVSKFAEVSTSRFLIQPHSLRTLAADFVKWADETESLYKTDSPDPATPPRRRIMLNEVLIEIVDGCLSGIISTNPNIEFHISERDGGNAWREPNAPGIYTQDADVVDPVDFALAAGMYALDEALTKE